MSHNLNRFLKICLDIADYYDKEGEKKYPVLEDSMLRELGMGYRALSGYLRNGVTEVIELQNDFHHTVCLYKAEKKESEGKA
jgi:hypothetical protein